MGWPTIDDQRLPRGVYSFGANPPAKKTARAESVADGLHTIRGPWWCRDLLPEYVTDYVWNPLNQDLFVDLSALTDITYAYKWPAGCITTNLTAAEAFPAGQPVTLSKFSYLGQIWSWFYRYDIPTPQTATKSITVMCSRIEDIALINRPPICYALGIYAQKLSPVYEGGFVWFGIKSGNDPRGEYVMACTNSARPVSHAPTNGLRIYYQTGSWAPTNQLCPCNIDYTPQILSFTVT